MITLKMADVLPAARAALEAGILQAQRIDIYGVGCLYSGPCAIGAALTREQAIELDNQTLISGTSIRELVTEGIVELENPVELDDFVKLQETHDSWAMTVSETTAKEREGNYFRTVLSGLEEIYLG